MRNKINILFVNPSLFIGGAEIVIRNICYHLDPDEFNVSICCLKERGTIGDELYEAGFDIDVIPQVRNGKVDYFTFKKLLLVIKEKKINLIHSHATQSLSDSCMCSLLYRFSKLRPSVVHTFHCGDYPGPKKSRDMLERIFWRFTDQLVAVGNSQKKQLQNYYHIPDNKITTVWNGVSPLTSKIDTNFEKFNNKCQGTVVGTIGTLFKQKGLIYLLETAAILKRRGYDVTFLVAGEGPLRHELEEKRKILGLEDSVLFLGWVQNASSSMMPYIDVFFQPSLWEAMSVVILEAMMAGKPIVATNVGENGYVINHEVDGFLVNPKSVDQMVFFLEKLINNRKLRKQVGSAGREKYEKTFTAQAMTEKYEKLYLNMLSNK